MVCLGGKSQVWIDRRGRNDLRIQLFKIKNNRIGSEERKKKKQKTQETEPLAQFHLTTKASPGPRGSSRVRVQVLFMCQRREEEEKDDDEDDEEQLDESGSAGPSGGRHGEADPVLGRFCSDRLTVIRLWRQFCCFPDPQDCFCCRV